MYVLIFNPTESLKIYGPFGSSDEAAEFGTKWQAEHDDNPCWNVIENPDVNYYPAP